MFVIISGRSPASLQPTWNMFVGAISGVLLMHCLWLLVAVLSANAATPGSVVAWGRSNVYGQTNVPSGLSGVTTLAAGYGHTVALKDNETVVAWGYNYYGQVTGTPTTATPFTAIANPVSLQFQVLSRGVTAIAAGYGHTVALRSDGMVVAWGDNTYGQANWGIGGVVAVAAGYWHTMALKHDGTVVAWGGNNSGQTDVPTGLSGVVAIAAGGAHSVALKNDGTVVAWGDSTSHETWVPVGLTGVTAIAAGYSHTVALKNDGTVVTWGDYPYDQTMNVPVGLNGVVAIAAGESFTVALKNDGTVVAWGHGGLYGAPYVPAGLSGVTAIAAGVDHIVAHIGIAPIITAQPESQSVNLGQDVSFTVTADGSTPLRYQWRKDGTNLNGATNAAYILTGAQTNQAGNYSVVVSNVAGSVTSGPPAVLMFIIPPPPPQISTQPANQTVNVGQNAIFMVVATGFEPFPLSYQWQRNGVNLPGATNSALNVSGLRRTNSGNYSCVVTGAGGSVTSVTAALRVRVPQSLPPPAQQPSGAFRLLSSDNDGGLLATNDLPNFEVHVSTNLTFTNWIRFTNGFSLTNGMLLFDDLGATNQAKRFYRVIEK
jgi:hypothetical protein